MFRCLFCILLAKFEMNISSTDISLILFGPECIFCWEMWFSVKWWLGAMRIWFIDHYCEPTVVNLSNILWSLFSFRHAVMLLKDGDSQSLMMKLQWLFAFLEHSQVYFLFCLTTFFCFYFRSFTIYVVYDFKRQCMLHIAFRIVWTIYWNTLEFRNYTGFVNWLCRDIKKLHLIC